MSARALPIPDHADGTTCEGSAPPHPASASLIASCPLLGFGGSGSVVGKSGKSVCPVTGAAGTVASVFFSISFPFFSISLGGCLGCAWVVLGSVSPSCFDFCFGPRLSALTSRGAFSLQLVLGFDGITPDAKVVSLPFHKQRRAVDFVASDAANLLPLPILPVYACADFAAVLLLVAIP